IDLGPISLDWFEELSSEAPPYEPKLLGEPDGPVGWLDQTFKTPKAKSSTYSQLASTPLIFKEQNTMPPFSSPGKELDQKKMGTRQYGSLFCTPKFLEIRTPKRISESLGAEVDPEMSWSSSLATPPTLGATVIIGNSENEQLPRVKSFRVYKQMFHIIFGCLFGLQILRNFFPKDDECTAKNDTSLLSVPETERLNAKDDFRDLESEVLDGIFAETASFEDSFNLPAESSGTLLLLPRALDAIEKCEIKIDEEQGKGGVPSEQPVRRKTAISQVVKAANWTEKSCCVEVNDSVFQNSDEVMVDSKDSCLIGNEKELEHLRIAGNLQDNGTQKSSVNEKLVKDVLPSSSQWSQLNLSDLDVTHLEMSVCSSPPSDLHREKGLEEKSVLMTKDDAVETSLLNTSGLKNAQEFLGSDKLANCSDTKISKTNPTSEITPVKSVCESPKLAKGCATEEISKMSFLNCSSFSIESTNIMEYSVVYNSTFSTHLKAASKSVVTDVVSHQFICSATSPDDCSDLHLTNSKNVLRKSNFKSLNMLSRLRKKSKRFIYTINNTLVYQEENVQKEVTSESPANPLTHLESDSHEFKGCQVATNGNQDCLLSAERQLNIKENHFNTSTTEEDTMDNSSDNSVSNRPKQELSDSGKNARECQPATSFKCIEASHAQSEGTADCLNSGRISNIKRKALTSACLMAGRRSGLFPEDCCLGKGKNDTSVSSKVNSRVTVPQSPKGQPPQSSPGSDHLMDTHRGAAFVTSSKFNNTSSQVKFGMNIVNSNSCNKISADKKHATDQLSTAECREIIAPLGINCWENNSTGLKKQGAKDVAESQGTLSVETSGSPPAAVWNSLSAEIDEEFLDSIDKNSLTEVVSEEDRQTAQVYCSRKPVENLEQKEKSSGNINVCSSSLSFGGFQTASNKQIKLSDSSIAKGKMLFKDIENECFEASSMERVRNVSNQVQKEDVFSLESKTGSTLSGSQTRHVQFIPHKVNICKNSPRSQLSMQESNQSLTASQEAEVAELSSILEETGSQFEFTQFRKQNNLIPSHVQHFGPRNVENASEAGEDTNFCSALQSGSCVINEYCSKLKGENEECKMVEREKEDTVVFYKNNKKVSFTNLDRNESGISDHESCPVPLQASFCNFVGFTSAGGKKINISKAALTRSAELFKDLDDDNFLFKPSETNTACYNSDGHVSSNREFVRCQAKEDKGGILCVPNIKSVGPISHPSEKKYTENVSTPCKENVENWTEILSDSENVDFSCTSAGCSASGMRNSLSSFKKPHQNCKISDQFLNQAGSQTEGCLQEDSLYAMCLGDNIGSAEEHGLSVSGEMENLSPNQEEDRKQEDEHLLQNCQAADTDAVSVSHLSVCSSLRDLNVQCEERDTGVAENSSEQKTDCVSVEGEDSSHKTLLVNGNGIKIGSYQHHRVHSEQETDVKGTYLTGFHTASGKKIAIADGFLAKAEQFFSENNIDLGRDDNGDFEDCLRKCNKNCVKDCDLCMDSVAQCDADVLNFKEKFVPEEPGDQLKQTIERSPIERAINHGSFKVGALVNEDEDCEINLAASHSNCGSEKTDSKHLNKPDCNTNCFTSTVDNAHREQSEVDLPEDGTDITCLHKTSLDAENRKSDPKYVVFSTAKGKAVSVSESALASVKHMFQTDCSESAKSEIETKSGTNQTDIAGNLSVSTHAGGPGFVTFLSNTKSETDAAASHFINENGNLSENDHQGANTFAEVDSIPDSQMQCFEQESKLSGHLPVPGKHVEQMKQSGPSGNLGFFSTASGKPVQLSEESLKRARQLFCEVEGSHSSGLHDALLPEEDTEKPRSHDEILTREMQLALPRGKGNAGTDTISSPALGFSTASGKQVSVSESAYRKAKAILQQSDDFLSSEFSVPDELREVKDSGQRAKCLTGVHHVKITEYVPQTEISIFQTPKGYLKTGAVRSAKAFVEGDLSDSGVQVKSVQSFIGKMSDNFQNKPLGKRYLEEKDSLVIQCWQETELNRNIPVSILGEPPIKRQLLLEFEKTKIPPRSLKPSKTTPDGNPGVLVTTKERQEVRNPVLTLPDQDLKGFKSKPAVFQHCALGQSSSGASGFVTPQKAEAKESKEARSLYKSGKAVKTFVPPFKMKPTLPAGEQGSSKRCLSPIRNNVMEEMELNQVTVEQNSAEAQHPPSCILHAAVTGSEDDNLVVSDVMANLRCARDLQEMRIKKKYRQNISPQPGSLYVIKTSARNRISLKTAVEEETPMFHSKEKLYTYGVSKHCIQVNSTNAESFQFLIKEFFSKECLLAGSGIQLADGGWLIPTEEGKAGKKEFYRALCDTPGVDPKLITEAWVYNHYRWIVWKLAAMEVSFPHKFANRCLTPETVLLQLKYRYDLEIDKSKRSAIKKITERDDAAGKTLVLCISKVISLNTAGSPSNSNNSTESEKAAAIIEVTDGWYGIRALLDPPLKAFLRRRRLTVGQKIIVHGAELIGSPNGCTPLEAPDSLMLKKCFLFEMLYFSGWKRHHLAHTCFVTAELKKGKLPSMQRVNRRNWKLCLQKSKQNLKSMKRKRSFSTERNCRRTPRSHIVTRQQIHNLQDGAELYEAIRNAPDPGYMEGYLSEDQLKALNAHKQLMNDKKQTRIQEEFKKAVESAEQEKHGCSKRDVSTVWKLFVVDYRRQEKHKGVILSIWRPLLDVCSLLKEGSRYRIYQLSTSPSKGRSDSANIQLSATKKTQYLQVSASQKMLVQIFFPRKALQFTSLLDPSYQPPCAEVDVVGVVISISRTGFATMVYLSDESYNLVAIKIWADLRHFAIEDIVVRCSFVAASNLQWQSEFRSEIPVLLAGDLSAFSANPKENHLQEKFNELKRMIEISSRVEMKHQSPLSASTPNAKLPQGSAVTPSSAASNQHHPRNSRKRKAMDFLSCIPAPPPLTPICSTVPPALKKAFQPPRSLGVQHGKSAREANPSTGCVTPSGKLREAAQLPENDLVADEELAMINTQALVNTAPEEKVGNVSKDSTRAANLSADLAPKNGSRSATEANCPLKSSSGGALQEDPEEPQGSLSIRRVPRRRRCL
ncbi:UNVERIFIED_CONTAM: hypothetical protein H355_001639, partial [Colinus virginianus]